MTTRTLTMLVAMGAAMSALASGGGDDDRDRRRDPVADRIYVEECGSCHVAYPPALLSRASWKAVVGRLATHFGVDASLEAAMGAEINAYLQARASLRDTVDGDGRTALRITETAWFRHEHRPGEHGLYRGVFEQASVGSPAKCDACHRGAAGGRYGEGEIRLP